MAALGAAGGHAQAGQRTSRLAAFIEPGGLSSDEIAARVRQLVRAQLAADERFECVEVTDRSLCPGRLASDDALQKAADLYLQGVKAYDSLDPVSATGLLQESIRLYEANTATLVSLEPLRRALIHLGAAQLINHNDQEACLRSLRLAAQIDPKATPDPQVFNPSFIDLYEKARRDVLAAPKCAVRITSNPAGAEIYLDGRFLGISPSSREDIPCGRHYFRLEKDGHCGFGAPLDTGPSAPASLVAHLTGLADSGSRSDMLQRALELVDETATGETAGQADELAVSLDVEYLVLVKVYSIGEKVRLVGVLYHSSSKTIAAAQQMTGSASLDGLEESVRGFLTRLLDAEALNRPAWAIAPDAAPAKVVPGPPFGHGSAVVVPVTPTIWGVAAPEFKTYLSWGLVGLGGAMIASGVICGSLALRANDRFSGTAQPDAGSIAGTGRTEAALADVFVSVGAASAVSGVLLLLLWEPSPASTTRRSASATPTVDGIGLWSSPESGSYLTVSGRY